MEPRYVHTNVVARDYRRLARFYEEVFGCVPVPPERDLGGEWLARGAGLPSARLRGVHLRLPGSTATLEIFQYEGAPDRAPARADERGWGHLAFAVDDVGGALEQVLAHGGLRLGEPVEREVPGAGRVEFVYVRDPEGNVIELQRWSSPEVSVEEGYARWAAGYDADENPTRDAASAVVRRWLPPHAGRSVLELGCGTGRNTAALSDAACVVGIDASAAMLEHARARAPQAQLVLHDLCSRPWPVAPESFDRAVESLVLEHLGDLRGFFEELARALRPGAKALLVELHPYRQIEGAQARFLDDAGRAVRVAAHRHSVSELLGAALASRLAVRGVGEHGDGGDAVPPGERPRLLSVELARP